MSCSDFPALRARASGDKVSASVERCGVDELSPGDVLIRAKWSSVNYKDALAATGQGRLIREFPRIPGIDVAGVVESSDSPDFSPGQEVLVTGYELGTGHDGGYSAYVRVPAGWVVPLPEGMDCRTAMLLGTAGFTVALCLRRLRDNGQYPGLGSMAVSGASGGVGMIAVAMLSSQGYEVCAISGKRDMHALLKELGASETLEPDGLFADSKPLRTSRWGGGIDNVGGALLADMLSAVHPWGNVVSVGLAAGADLPATVMPFILRGVSLLGVSSSNCPPEWRPELWQELENCMPSWLPQKLPQREVGLRQLPEVFPEMLRRATHGRILVNLEQ